MLMHSSACLLHGCWAAWRWKGCPRASATLQPAVSGGRAGLAHLGGLHRRALLACKPTHMCPPTAVRFQVLRQDVRNLHLEVLQQFHQAQVRGVCGAMVWRSSGLRTVARV